MEISICFKLVMLISELFPVIIIRIRPFFSCVLSINGYCCCSGLYQLGSSHCLLLWEPMDKASAQGKLSPVLSSPSYFSSFLMSLAFLMLPFVHFFQFPQSVGPRLRCTAASRPAEGAVGLFYRPVI